MGVMREIGIGGVDIFFVISGFIIVWVAHRAAGGSRPFSLAALKTALIFAFHRAARIFPLFWITLAAMLAVTSMNRSYEQWLDLVPRLSDLFLITRPAALSVAWTLVFEVNFYASAALLILLAGRWTAIAFALWGLLQVAIVIVLIGVDAPPFWFFHPISIEFVLGAALAVSVICTSSRKVPLMVWGAAAAIVAGVLAWSGNWAYPDPMARVLVWGVPAMGVLYGVIVLETARGFVFPAWLRRCGDWSYSIYLWHLPVLIALRIVVQGLGRKGTFAGGVGYVVLGIVLSLTVAALSYRYIESPVMRWVARTRSSPVPAPGTAAVSVEQGR